MQQPTNGDDSVREGADAGHALEARRRMLRRSLGVVAPVALTLTSAPVSAGTCTTASAFASIAAFASRPARAVTSCAGLSPSGWLNAPAEDWPVPKDTLFAEVLGIAPGSGMASTDTLEAVLNQRTSMEAYVSAVWLSARARRLEAPFSTDTDVKNIWLNIQGNPGFFYHPVGAPPPMMSHQGTLDWLEKTWL